MTSEQLVTGLGFTVRYQDGGFPCNFDTSAPVGGGLWSDATDVTYTAITTGATLKDFAYSESSLLFTVDPSGVFDFVLTARVEVTSGPASHVFLTIGAAPDPGVPTSGATVPMAVFDIPPAAVGAGPINLPPVSMATMLEDLGHSPAEALGMVQDMAARFDPGVVTDSQYLNAHADAAGAGSPNLVLNVYEVSFEVVAVATCLQNAERSSCVQVKHPDGTWANVSLVGV